MKLDELLRVVSSKQSVVVRHEKPSIIAKNKEVVDEIKGNRSQLYARLIDLPSLKVKEIKAVGDDLVVIIET